VGFIVMSERDLQRIEVLSKIVECRMKVVTAAHVLELSPRQVRRLVATFTRDGAAAIRHKARGCRPNNQINKDVREYTLALVLGLAGL